MKIIITLILFFVSINPVQAQTDCPLGLVNDPAPGSCARYIDTDSNELCDLSEVPLKSDYGAADKSGIEYLSEEELKAKTVKEVAEIYGIETNAYRAALTEFLGFDVKGGDSLLALHDNNGLCSGVAASIALGLKEDKDISDIAEHDLVSGEEIKAMKVYEAAELYGIDQQEYANALAEILGVKVALTKTIREYHDKYGLEANKAKEIANELVAKSGVKAGNPTNSEGKDVATPARYKFLPIAAVTLILYFFTWLLSRKKFITLLIHKRIWNVILLVSFLASGILALLLIIRINWGWIIPLPFNMLYWHVETGTIMFLISLIHIFEHRRFYACMIARKKKSECESGD